MFSHAAKALPPCPEDNSEWHMCIGTYDFEWVRGGEFKGEWRSGRPYKGTETYRSGDQAGEKYVGIFKKGKPIATKVGGAIKSELISWIETSI